MKNQATERKETTPNGQEIARSVSNDLLHRVSTDEVKELLRRVGNGESVPRLKDPGQTWESVYAGDIAYFVDGWTVVIFNDCDDWDYVDSVIAPDGRRGEFDDWFGPGDEEGNRPWMQPDCLLDHDDSECYLRMVKAFIEAV